MTWTTTPPQKPGWYWNFWFCDAGGNKYTTLYIVKVVKVKRKTWQGLKRGTLAIMDSEMGEVEIQSGPSMYWLGPLPIPAPPEEPQP